MTRLRHVAAFVLLAVGLAAVALWVRSDDSRDVVSARLSDNWGFALSRWLSNSSGDMLMDTRGLSEIGLHDLQCHFCDLDPNEVSALLFNTAVYLFDNGPVIESGNTVAGIGEGSKWVCQFENALVPPEREVLDLNPGPPHAAGGRA